jgi:hypothetical protein
MLAHKYHEHFDFAKLSLRLRRASRRTQGAKHAIICEREELLVAAAAKRGRTGGVAKLSLRFRFAQTLACARTPFLVRAVLAAGVFIRFVCSPEGFVVKAAGFRRTWSLWF